MKRLIVCCDGTWNDADSPSETTNVVRMARAIKPQDNNKIEQVVYYHSGVGTGGGELTTMLGGATGLGLGRNVRDAYAFLASNYCDGDELYLFGFSRGAYTARSVAGLIGWAGLLHRPDMDDFDLVWDTYRQRPSDPAQDAATRNGLLETHFPDRHKDVSINCLGVWDTVGALGIPGDKTPLVEYYDFYDTTLGRRVAVALQALALDERRSDFTPTLWDLPNPPVAGQTLLQVWFPGVHSDVGGGYPEHGLSDVALAWMAGEVAARTPLALDEAYLKQRQDRRLSWAQGMLHDSARGPIWALRQKTRVPGQATAPRQEYLHQSVEVRRAADPTYGHGALTLDVLPLNAMESRLRWNAPDQNQTGDTTRPKPSAMWRLLRTLGGG